MSRASPGRLRQVVRTQCTGRNGSVLRLRHRRVDLRLAQLERYGGISALEILGEPAPGFSTGDAMFAIAEIMKELPPGIGLAYTGLSYEKSRPATRRPCSMP